MWIRVWIIVVNLKSSVIGQWPSVNFRGTQLIIPKRRKNRNCLADPGDEKVLSLLPNQNSATFSRLGHNNWKYPNTATKTAIGVVILKTWARDIIMYKYDVILSQQPLFCCELYTAELDNNASAFSLHLYIVVWHGKLMITIWRAVEINFHLNQKPEERGVVKCDCSYRLSHWPGVCRSGRCKWTIKDRILRIIFLSERFHPDLQCARILVLVLTPDDN